MSWSAATVGAAAGFPGAEASEVDPTWRPWLDLLDIALEEPESPWQSAVIFAADRPAGAPLVHGATLALDAERAGTLVRRLTDSAGIARGATIDARAAIRAAIARDGDSLAAMAERCDASLDSFALLAQVASMPMLLSISRAHDERAARAWQRGYCPVCGAWPSLAESRGIERERRLRCGSCSADWPLPLLRCAFCGEGDHAKLGSLLVDGEEHLRRVDTCESCRGYLKVVTTFEALGTPSLLMVDVGTVPLDLVAHERGYARPTPPGWGWAPTVEIAS
jgi:FdhE protein